VRRHPSQGVRLHRRDLQRVRFLPHRFALRRREEHGRGGLERLVKWWRCDDDFDIIDVRVEELDDAGRFQTDAR